MRRIHGRNKGAHLGVTLVVLFVLILAAGIASFWVGRYPIDPVTVLKVIAHHLGLAASSGDPAVNTVIMDVRLPRIGLALLVGAALSVSGSSYQTLFKNPMVSPDILGVSAGAGFGAALAMVNELYWWQIQLSALLFGLLAVAAANLIGYVFARQEITVMVLGGIVVSSFFQALLSIVKTLADTEEALPSITFWLMGSLGRAKGTDVLVVMPGILVPMAVLYLFRHQVDALAAGEDEALTLGVNVPVVRTVVIVCATLMTVSSVCVTGIVGWVGLVVPHIARTIVGASFPAVLVSSAGAGALFLLLVDDVIRGIPGMELPLGVLTALIGTPLFVALLGRVRKGWL